MSQEIDAYKAVGPNRHVIDFIEGGQKLYITEVSGKILKAKKAHYMVLNLAEKADLIEFL